jgi:hypothetical protein
VAGYAASSYLVEVARELVVVVANQEARPHSFVIESHLQVALKGSEILIAAEPARRAWVSCSHAQAVLTRCASQLLPFGSAASASAVARKR